jgi:SAM-dependent methyltransferase
MTDAGAEAAYLADLIELHRGLPRQGPGDADFSRRLLLTLPQWPQRPRIADLGCGSGAGALLLAEFYGTEVLAVDTAAVLLEELARLARERRLQQLVRPVLADMRALPFGNGSLDLLWSEGAAYNLGFETALTRWRPLLADDGVAVVSEMSWFTEDAPAAPREFWSASYPTMAGEAENRRRAQRAGFAVLGTERLPDAAWWKNYYGPLRERIEHLPAALRGRAAVAETEQEMRLFEQFSRHYGYTFYILQAAGPGRSAAVPSIQS